MSSELSQGSPSIQPEAIALLQNQPWPGNVRELENAIRESLLLARGYPIAVEHVQQASTRSRKAVVGSDQTLAAYCNELLAQAQTGQTEGARARMMEDMERELFTRAIELAQGNQAKAARWLGVTRTTMREKLTQFGARSTGETPEPPPDRFPRMNWFQWAEARQLCGDHFRSAVGDPRVHVLPAAVPP